MKPSAFAPLIAMLVLVAPAVAQAEGRLVIGPTSGAQPNSTPFPPYIVKPSINVNLTCNGESKLQKIDLEIQCTDYYTGEPWENCYIDLTLEPEPYSGFHDHHDANRLEAVGKVSYVNGHLSGPDGWLTVKYEAPEVAGVINVTANGVGPLNDLLIPDTFPVYVERGDIFGLEFWPLFAGANSPYKLIGETQWHGVNHWGELAMIDSLTHLAARYYQKTGSKLEYNDMSLPGGGVFDVCTDPAFQQRQVWSNKLQRMVRVCPDGAGSIWHRPHAEHRCGITVDMRIPQNRSHRLILEQLLDKRFALHKEGDHYHVTRR